MAAKAKTKAKAKAKTDKVRVKLESYAHVHKLAAGVSLLAFFVIVIAGWRVDASLPSRIILILWRAAAVLVAIQLVTFAVVRILKTYEEMNSGEA